MPIYTAADFDKLSETAELLQQQQWAKAFDKPAANALIGAWRSFMQNSVAAHALAGVARKEGLAGLVADAQTYAAASKAVRLLLDQNFHTIKARHHAMLRSQDLVLLDWLRLFHTECLSVAEQDMRFLGIKHYSELTAKAEVIARDLAALRTKRAILDAEILQLEVHTGALAEVRLGLQKLA